MNTRRTTARLSCITLCVTIWFPFNSGAARTADNQEQKGLEPDSRRPVTVADAIQMTRSTERPLAHFSPDGRKFVVVLRKGNLEQNTNEYSLLLWRTDEVFRSPAPEVLLTMSSSSNRAAIKDLTWLSDDETITFLGERPGEVQQVYTFNASSRGCKKLTNHATSVTSYSITPRGDRLAYVAEEPATSIFNETTRRQGVLVSTQSPIDLTQGRSGYGVLAGRKLFFQDGNGPSHPVRTIGEIAPWGGDPSLSPDGQHIVIATQVTTIPENWNEYADPRLKRGWGRKLAAGGFSWLHRLELIDTATGLSQVFLPSPVNLSGTSEIAWSSNSQSVVITGIYLPLDNTTGEERRARQTSTFNVEVKIRDKEIVKISQQKFRLLEWNTRSNELVFELGTGDQKPWPKVFFAKKGEHWEQVARPNTADARPQVTLEQDMNIPPEIFVTDPVSHEKSRLLDLNPQFRSLEFARVEQITWKTKDGQEVKGGLYYPMSYEPGKRYPIVIQTHGFRPDLFWIDGPWTTAFGAQPLAGKGFMVLQVGESYADMDTPKEVEKEISSYEGAIAILDEKKLIDRNKVGIIAFSRTCLFVERLLTKPNNAIAAASINDGYDGSYLQYMIYSVASPYVALMSESVNGGVPFGQGLTAWMRNASGFNLDKVHAAVRIVAANPHSLLGQWDWFAGLSRLGKPVEMILIEDGVHVLEKPWDRMISQQGNVDWFCFWLKGEEDPDPAKVEQYARWRQLRKLQQQNEKNSPPSPN